MLIGKSIFLNLFNNIFCKKLKNLSFRKLNILMNTHKNELTKVSAWKNDKNNKINNFIKTLKTNPSTLIKEYKILTISDIEEKILKVKSSHVNFFEIRYLIDKSTKINEYEKERLNLIFPDIDYNYQYVIDDLKNLKNNIIILLEKSNEYKNRINYL
ncbi:hypothetical protein EHP00_1186 [Ecytonucleospora hepatopenaei]|uniref:Uncharacterized protein n=1 Tax=Ecytonucleospora hepatopenaei TaxID=646526 RepID=A0A1W0E877_9MICR|nr:hypothetical protein EHP00_1186 [Ecytonucleospora hepatopenaei]